MTDTRTITLGGRTFDVPPLPLRINKRVYPLAKALTDVGLIDRIVEGGGMLDCTEAELNDLAEVAFLAVSFGEGAIDREAFEDLPITPPELIQAFFLIRYQTGAWVPGEVATDQGEAEGAEQPPQ